MIRIGASADPKEIASCLKVAADQGEVALPDVAFGGAVWKVFSFENAGMQQYVRGVSYRTMHEGRCVALEKMATGSNYREDPASIKDIPDAELDARYQDLERIVQTFTFVR